MTLHNLAVGAVLKNESHILQEWITHHRRQGVDHFYLIDNDSTDAFDDTVSQFVEAGLVTVIRDPTRYQQEAKYNTHFLSVAQRCEWFLIIDLDEFMYARNGFQNIADFLRTLPVDTGSFSVPWKFYGSDGLIKQPANVVSGNIHRKSYAEPTYMETKTAVRGAAIESFKVHEHVLRPGYAALDVLNRPKHSMGTFVTEQLLASSPLHLNHYPLQSRDWFMQVKATRGAIEGAVNDHIRNEAYFAAYDTNEVHDDELARKA